MKMKKRGFTLTEMVVTLAVIGILAILLPVVKCNSKAHAKSRCRRAQLFDCFHYSEHGEDGR